MGDPLKPATSNTDATVENSPTQSNVESVEPILSNPLPNTPVESPKVIEPVVSPTTTPVLEPAPIVEPSEVKETKTAELLIPAMELEPIEKASASETKPAEVLKNVTPAAPVTPVIKNTLPEETIGNPITPPLVKEIEKSGSNNKRRLIVIVAILLLLTIGIVIAIVIYNSMPKEKPSVTLEDNPVVSTPVGATTKDFSGKLYPLTFKYSVELGNAVSKTTKLTYPASAGGGDCNTEDVSFSNDKDLTLGVATGHCEGGSAPTTNYTQLASKDGKSFFMVIKKLDETLFPGLYTITVTGGVDSTDNFAAAIKGVRIDAIRVKDVEKYTKYIKDIVSSLSVELSPLKTDTFDINSNI